MPKHHGHIEERVGRDGVTRYRVKVYRPKTRAYESFTASSHALAERTGDAKYKQFLIEKMEQQEGELIGASQIRFKEWLARYRDEVLAAKPEGARAAYEASLRLIEPYFVKRGNPKLAAIRSAHVRQFLAHLRVHAKRVKVMRQSTINKHRAVFSAVLGYAVKLEILTTNPVTKIRADKAESHHVILPSDAEYELLIAACGYDPMLQTYTLLLGESGVRCDSEALWLAPSDLDFEEGLIHVGLHHPTKAGRVRVVPMTKRLAEHLKRHVEKFQFAVYHGARSPWLFHRVVDSHGHKAGERVETMRKFFNRAARSVGLPKGFRQHDLRHYRGTKWAVLNATLAQHALGHADAKMVAHYTHVSGQHLKALVTESD